MSGSNRGGISRMLVALARVSLAHPYIVLLLAVALTGASLVFAFRIGLQTDLKALLPDDYESILRLNRLKDRMGAQSDLLVEIRSPDAEANQRIGAQIAGLLRARNDIRYVIFQREKEALEKSALLFLPRADLEDLHERVKERIRREIRKDMALDEDDDEAAPAAAPGAGVAPEPEAPNGAPPPPAPKSLDDFDEPFPSEAGAAAKPGAAAPAPKGLDDFDEPFPSEAGATAQPAAAPAAPKSLDDFDEPFPSEAGAAAKPGAAAPAPKGLDDFDEPFPSEAGAAAKPAPVAAKPEAAAPAAAPAKDGAGYTDEDLALDEESLRKRFGDYDVAEYQSADEGRVLVVTARPAFPTTEVKASQALVKEMQQAIAALNPKTFHPDMEVALRGHYADMDNQVKVMRDEVFSSSIVSFLLLGLIVVLFFRAFRPVVLIFVPLIMSAIWCVGMAQLLYGSLNLVSAFIFGILLGFGIDFGIHLVARQREEIWAGLAGKEAFLEAVATTGVSVFTGGTTTAVTFFVLHFARFKGFSQFGIAAGGGVMFSLIAMYTVLPACVAVYERFWPWRPRRLVSHLSGPKLTQRLSRHPWFARVLVTVVLVASAGFTAYSAIHLPHIGFEYDFSKLGMRPKPADPNAPKKTDYREALDKDSTRAPAIAMAADAESARWAHRQLAHLDELIDDGTDLKFLASAAELQDPQLRELAKVWGIERIRLLSAFLIRVFSLYTFLPEDQAEKLPILADIRTQLERKRGLFKGKDLENLDKFLDHVPQKPFTLGELPAWIRDQFKELDGREGQFLIVWTRGSKDSYSNAKAIKTALFDMPLPGGGTLGTAANYYVLADIIDTIRGDAVPIMGGAVAVILLLVALHLRRPKAIAMVLIPLALVTLWACGYLYAADEKLNFYNMVLLPLIVGMAVDAGVHIFARYQENGAGSLPRTVVETGSAVFIAQLTTVVGFGGMFTSEHVGLASMGWLCIVGTALCFLGSVATVPALLWVFERMGRPIAPVIAAPSEAPETP